MSPLSCIVILVLSCPIGIYRVQLLIHPFPSFSHFSLGREDGGVKTEFEDELPLKDYAIRIPMFMAFR